MASRRLKSDRFFTTDFTPRVYTQTGMDWIADKRFSTVLLRHAPGLAAALRRVDNPFAPGQSRRGDLMAITLDDLTTMSQAELDDLFRRSPIGRLPDGDASGTAIVAPGTEIEARCMHSRAGWPGRAKSSIAPRAIC